MGKYSVIGIDGCIYDGRDLAWKREEPHAAQRLCIIDWLLSLWIEGTEQSSHASKQLHPSWKLAGLV